MRQDDLQLPQAQLPANSHSDAGNDPHSHSNSNRASAVESWLDGVTNTILKPSPHDFSQWKADRRPKTHRAVYVTALVLRVFSTLLALSASVLVGLSLSQRWRFWSTRATERMILALVLCPLIAAWNSAEFITMAALEGKGIPPRLHVWFDGLFAMLLPVAAGLYIWKIIDYLPGWPLEDGTIDLVAAGALLGLMFVHWFLFFFFWCSGMNKLGRKNGGARPRIMYLTTGQPVVVTPAPVVVQRPIMPPPVELVQLHAPQVPAQPPPQVAPAGGSQLSPAAISPTSPAGSTPRKPVAGANVGTHYASPWPGPEYQPDEAEKARALRGERQAQWMTLHGMGLRGEEKSGLGLGLGNHARETEANVSTGKTRRLSV
ncbi:hypothetical protein B0T16DRAFT_406853 [Cercophora newfieldiana]|uniref:Uncharacterized protein n=1 Tax=Cercophora newfieldiana TaxID=92897 RepID=A0AA39YJN7_9PEZI|nr:hypothetical protein B0T16DRAFT_406853 [Cercophora newfieldiana]